MALIPVCTGVFIAADDQTVVVTVLPNIMLDMEVQVNQLDRASWTITGYLLGYVAAMPLIGRLSDVWGHRRLFIVSTALFMAGSAGVALAPNLTWLVALRVFQAVGAGALVPISIAIVGDLFPPGSRGLPMGIVGASAEAGGVIGPLWGGMAVRFSDVLNQAVSPFISLDLDWQWVFWINIPLGSAVLLAVFLLLNPSPRYRARVDYLGGGLIAVSLASLTLGLARVDAPGPLMAGYLLASGASLALFIVRQRSTAEPLFPTSMFWSWTLGAANGTQLLVGGALIIGMVTIPLMADTVLGQQPLEGGLRLMRLTAAIPVGAILGGIVCQRMDYRVPTVVGLVLAALGFVFMSRWDLEVADPTMTAYLVTAGLGFGLVIAPIALAATNTVRAADRGTAAALITATRMVGMTLGLATLTAWGTDRFQGLVAGLQLPLLQPVETLSQRLRDAGLTLFNEFFLVAMGLSLIAILPAAIMAWHPRRQGP